MDAVGSPAHAFLAAGNDDTGVAPGNLLGADGHRAQARAAQLVETPGGTLDRDAGADRCLPGGILALAGLQDLAHDDLVDVVRFHARTFQGAGDGNPAQVVGVLAGKGAVEGADGRSRCGNNHDIGHDGNLS